MTRVNPGQPIKPGTRLFGRVNSQTRFNNYDLERVDKKTIVIKFISVLDYRGWLVLIWEIFLKKYLRFYYFTWKKLRNNSYKYRLYIVIPYKKN